MANTSNLVGVKTSTNNAPYMRVSNGEMCIRDRASTMQPINTFRNLYRSARYSINTNDVGSTNKVSFYNAKNDYHIDITEEDQQILKTVRNDFVAFSYYSSKTVKYIDIDPTQYFFGQDYMVNNPYVETTEVWHWDIDPLALRTLMTHLYNRYQIPLFILENGIGLVEDGKRSWRRWKKMPSVTWVCCRKRNSRPRIYGANS